MDVGLPLYKLTLTLTLGLTLKSTYLLHNRSYFVFALAISINALCPHNVTGLAVMETGACWAPWMSRVASRRQPRYSTQCVSRKRASCPQSQWLRTPSRWWWSSERGCLGRTGRMGWSGTYVRPRPYSRSTMLSSTSRASLQRGNVHYSARSNEDCR